MKPQHLRSRMPAHKVLAKKKYIYKKTSGESNKNFIQSSLLHQQGSATSASVLLHRPIKYLHSRQKSLQHKACRVVLILLLTSQTSNGGANYCCCDNQSEFYNSASDVQPITVKAFTLFHMRRRKTGLMNILPKTVNQCKHKSALQIQLYYMVRNTHNKKQLFQYVADLYTHRQKHNR